MGLNNIEDKHKEELKFSNGIQGNIEKSYFLLITLNSIEDEHNGATKNTIVLSSLMFSSWVLSS